MFFRLILEVVYINQGNVFVNLQFVIIMQTVIVIMHI